MPIVEITMFEGRDEETKDRLAREITDAVAEHTGNSVDSIHVVFREMPRSSWSRGMVLASRRASPGGKPVRTDYASVSRIEYDPKTERDYLALRYQVINPGMATQAGFVSSLLLRPHDKTNEYLLVNKWLSLDHAKAYTSGPTHEALRQKAMMVLPKPLETVGADVVHLDVR